MGTQVLPPSEKCNPPKSYSHHFFLDLPSDDEIGDGKLMHPSYVFPSFFLKFSLAYPVLESTCRHVALPPLPYLRILSLSCNKYLSTRFSNISLAELNEEELLATTDEE